MKYIFFFLLAPLLSYGQIQIGQDILGESIGDFSGGSIQLSLDGSIVAISARGNDGNGSDSGHVRVFENIGDNWIQIGQDIDGEEAGDISGESISLSHDGSIIAIGTSNNGDFTGHVRIFENIGGSWIQIGQDIDGENEFDLAGRSVSLSSNGTIIAVGSPGNSNSEISSGHVRIFENIGGSWTQIGQSIDGEDELDNSGRSVSLSYDGSIVAIGTGLNGSSGHVRVYENINDTWLQIGQDIDGEEAGDFSGESISLSGDGTIVAVGAPENSANGPNSGHVRIYENINGMWLQIGQDIDGEEAVDRSGTSVSLSSDGSIIAIGASSNSANGFSSGHVRLYENINNTWVQIGQDIDGENKLDELGISVSLSSDGFILATGAIGNDINGNNAGVVRVFDLSGILSIEEVIPSQFSIYPNPASTNVMIQLDPNSTLEKAIIYNSLAQIVKTSTETIIDTSDLSKGMYILEVTTHQGKASKKLIIE